MKMRHLILFVLPAFLTIASCKKDSKDTQSPIQDNAELLGPEANKVIHYSFNGSLRDTSGNHLNANDNALQITYAADRFGRANQALVFPGNSNPVWINTPSISSRITGFPFSISVWFKAANVTNTQTLIRTDGGESSHYVGAWLQLGVGGEGTMSFSFGDGTGTSGSSRNTITTPSAFMPGNWYHVVINVRGANDMDFYINGVKNNNCNYSGNPTSMAYHAQFTGGVLGLFPGAYSVFEGLMDDYRIYSKVLSQTEVSKLYNFHP